MMPGMFYVFAAFISFLSLLYLEAVEVVIFHIFLAIFYSQLHQRSQKSNSMHDSHQFYQTVNHQAAVYKLRNLSSLLKYSQTHLESMSRSDLTFFLYRCTKDMGPTSDLFEDPRYEAVVRSLYEKLQFNVDIKACEMANIFWGMTKCGIAKHEGQYRDLIMFWANFVISHVDAFEMKYLANMLWSFASIYKPKSDDYVPSNEMLFHFCDEEVSIRLTELFTVVSKACQSKIMNDKYCLHDLTNISWSLAIASNSIVCGCDSLQPYKTLIQLVFDKCMNQKTYQSRQISNIATAFVRLRILSRQDQEILVAKMAQQTIKMSISSFEIQQFISLLWAFHEFDIWTTDVHYLFNQAVDQGLKCTFKKRTSVQSFQ